MKSIKSLTASMGVALYILARIPPTDLCPFKFSNPALFAFSKNYLSNAGSFRRNGIFIIDRKFDSTKFEYIDD